MIQATQRSRALAGLVKGGEDHLDGGVMSRDVICWLRQNKVGLMAIAPHAPPRLVSDESFQRALCDERDWYETQRREYVLVRNAWLEQEIACLMIKSAGNYPSFPHMSDNIDILVRPERARQARDILRQLGYVEVRNVEEPHKFLFRKFHAGRCVSAIHIHEQVTWFVGFMKEDALWERMRPADDDPMVNIPSPEDAILINLAHACYENKLLRLNDALRVRHALGSVAGNLDWGYMQDVASARGWLDGLCFMLLAYAAVEQALHTPHSISPALQEQIENILRRYPFAWHRLQEIRSRSSTDLPLDLSYWFCKRLYYRKVLADALRPVHDRWRDAALTLLWGVRLKSRIRPQPGMVVSLSGLDGSGKTAQARALVDAFRLCEIKSSYFWSRGGSTGLLGLVSTARRVLRPRHPLAQQRDMPVDSVTRRRKRLSNPLARFAWAWSIAADQVVTYTLRAHLPSRLGRVVVSDRYVYDTAVEMDASLPEKAVWSRLAIKAMLKMTPRPDIGYVLDLSPSTARTRKTDEIWHADVEQERYQYLCLTERMGLNLLSTEGEFADSNDRLIRETMMAYMAGYETWPNALFFYNPSQKNTVDPIWLAGGRGREMSRGKAPSLGVGLEPVEATV